MGYLGYLWALVAALRKPRALAWTDVAKPLAILAAMTPFDFVVFQVRAKVRVRVGVRVRVRVTVVG